MMGLTPHPITVASSCSSGGRCNLKIQLEGILTSLHQLGHTPRLWQSSSGSSLVDKMKGNDCVFRVEAFASKSVCQISRLLWLLAALAVAASNKSDAIITLRVFFLFISARFSKTETVNRLSGRSIRFKMEMQLKGRKHESKVVTRSPSIPEG